MEGADMLIRQLIGQLQEVLEIYGSPHPAAVPYNYCLQLQAQTQSELQHQTLRWCFFNLEDNNSSSEPFCYNLTMTAGKSENLKMLDPGKPPPTKKARKERNRGKSTSTTITTDPNMDPKIWREFPSDLFEPIIARLPIATFFRFRSVCQNFNSLLSSQSFSQQCAQLKLTQVTQPWFYTITHENVNTGAMYDPTHKIWHHPTIPALPTKSILLPVASAGGLVSFLDISHRNFYVCNPLTRSYKELPARSVKVWSRVAVGMTLCKKSSSYKVVWVGSEGEYEVYDSKVGSWARPGTMPLTVKLNFRSQSVSVDQTVYFMRNESDGLVSYDTVNGNWREFLIPSLGSTDHTLAVCGGRVFLVGLLSRNAATCVCVWELQKMSFLWKEVDRMPNEWCLEFYGKHVRMNCLGNKGLIMLSLRSRQMNRLVTYDLGKREWVKVPACVLPRGRKKQWIACGAAFQPCLTAVA